MTGNGTKTLAGDEKSPVEVRRKSAMIMHFRRIRVL